MKNFSEKLKMALWVFSPIVIVLSVYAVYLFAPVKNVELINTYESQKKIQKNHSIHYLVEAKKEKANEM